MIRRGRLTLCGLVPASQSARSSADLNDRFEPKCTRGRLCEVVSSLRGAQRVLLAEVDAEAG